MSRPSYPCSRQTARRGRRHARIGQSSPLRPSRPTKPVILFGPPGYSSKWVYQLEPGGFDRLPEATRNMLLDNARTAPLLFGGAPPPAITCDALRTFTRPTRVTHGEKTHAYYKLINE